MHFPFIQNRALPIGVDIGSTGVKLLQLRATPRGHEAVAASSALFDGTADEEPANRAKVLKGALDAALRGGTFKGRECVCSLPSSDLLVRAVRLPLMGELELNSVVTWEAADRFGIPADELQVDWIRAGEVTQADETRQEIILVAVRKTMVEAQMEAVMRGGLRPLACETSFTATARCLTNSLRRQSDSGVVRMIIDVGSSSTSIYFTHGRDITFVKQLPVGGAKLNDAVAIALKLSPDAAARLRAARLRGSESGGDVVDRRVEQAVFEAQRSLLHDLANEAALCLRYHSVTFRSGRPEATWITGSNACEPHLVQILSDVIKMPVRVANPIDRVDVSTSASTLDRRSMDWNQWATALGLSLRGDHAVGALSTPAQISTIQPVNDAAPAKEAA